MTDTNPTPQPLDLDAIRARVDATTPGPWHPRDVGYVFAASTTPRSDESGYDGTPIVDTFMWPEQGSANQLFISAAREDVPALLAEVEALRTERDGLAAVIERAPHGVTCSGWNPGRILWVGDACDCWKSAAPSDALAEVKREAWERGRAAGGSVAMRRMSDEPSAPDPVNPYAASREGRRCGTNVLVPGHTLEGHGEPYEKIGFDVASVWSRVVASQRGRGVSSCGSASPVLLSRAHREQWHREHKAEVLAR